MKIIIKVVLMCFLSVTTSAAYAATINGSFGIIGDLSATGGADLGSVTEISLSTVFGSGASAGDTSDVSFFSEGAGGSSVSLTGGALPASSFFTVEGWSFEISTLNVVDQRAPVGETPGLLSLVGTGILSGGAGFDPTEATWSFSSVSLGSFDMSVETATVIPVPAAVWLFGSGLIGLIGVARRKKS